jgi:tRNA 2-selenouridine synthase
MPIEKIDIDHFLSLPQELPVIDVRSPGEYNHAHLPGAFNVPLFTDEERATIGTAYKKQNRRAAVDHGLEFFSERMKTIPGQIENIISGWKQKNESSALQARDKKPGIVIYCWRGGMRSGAVAWLMSLYGDKIYTLNGGYKTFRRWALAQFEKKYFLRVLGGYTGSGKTDILKELKKNGKTIIDLEDLANHKGSAFGSLGEQPQPSHEMFENRLALQLWEVNKHNRDNQEIWIEDESVHIGTVGIPKVFWQQMQDSPLYFIDIPFCERVGYIEKTYSIFDKKSLIACTLKIQKRLGGLNTKNAIQFFSENNFREAFSILIEYYDKMYSKSLNNRRNFKSLKRVTYNKVDCVDAAKKLSLSILK